MRFARGGMRDHIVSHKNDHGASYRRYGVLPWRSRIKINFLRDFRRRSIFDFCNTIEVRADERRAPFDFRKTKGGPWRLATALPSSWEQFASLGRRSSWLRQASPFRIDCFPPPGPLNSILERADRLNRNLGCRHSNSVSGMREAQQHVGCAALRRFLICDGQSRDRLSTARTLDTYLPFREGWRPPASGSWRSPSQLDDEETKMFRFQSPVADRFFRWWPGAG